VSEKPKPDLRLDPRWTVFRCPKCGGFVCEGIPGIGGHIETYCRRCKPPADGERPRIVIEHKAA